MSKRLKRLPWQRWLSVRRGFLFGSLAGFLVAGSTLWAITSVQQILHPPRYGDPVAPGRVALPAVRPEIPPQLVWFFIQYPYVSESAAIEAKNLHAYVIQDVERGRTYVLGLAQKSRRVEIYDRERPAGVRVDVFMPGRKRTVQMEDGKTVSDAELADGNLWMWRAPLWNPLHLRIYGLADFWLNAPYKKYSCAGFVHKYLGDAGVKVPVRDAWDMARLPYKRVSLPEIEPGDIIALRAASARHRRFWGHSITHVGVYIGHGQFIHAATAHRKAKRAFIRLGDVDAVERRIAVILRPPDLL